MCQIKLVLISTIFFLLIEIFLVLVAKLPPSSAPTKASNKRPLEEVEDEDEAEEQKTSSKKRAVSKSTGSGSSSSSGLLVKKIDCQRCSFLSVSVRTVTTVAGQAPVDAECKSLIGKVHVYTENKDIFDCMLNQVRIDVHL